MASLSRTFAYLLVSIAFVYHLAHYYTLLFWQGSQMVKLVSDPAGVGWNLFATVRMDFPPIILGASAIWHTQVGLILAGPIASVFLAHIEALRLFRDTRRALLSPRVFQSCLQGSRFMNAQSGQGRQISAVAIATVVAVASVALIVGRVLDGAYCRSAGFRRRAGSARGPCPDGQDWRPWRRTG